MRDDFDPIVAWYPTKALTCASGKWCWAEWTGIQIDARAGGINKIYVSGVSSAAAPDVDLITLGAMR